MENDALSEGTLRSAIDQEYEGGGLTADEDRSIILGDAIQWLLEEVPENILSKQILEFLDMYLDDANERALFNLSPRLDYNNKFLPLKPPRDEI
jgi:hypothetical protein